MTAGWRKLGQLFQLPRGGLHAKLVSHAANPVPLLIDGDVYRIFYSGRDAQNRSSVGAVDVNVVSQRIVEVHSAPFFEHGPPGSFYESGVSIGCVHTVGVDTSILFMGWQTPRGEHWRGEIGALTVSARLTLSLASPTPCLARNTEDPISLSYPWVVRFGDADWRMWYGSTLSWDAVNSEMVHVIKAASSSDGKRWTRHGAAIPYKIGQAQAFSRPAVVSDRDHGLTMWFSYRSGTGVPYRIGCARSSDGVHWQVPLNEGGLDVSSDGWDSDMVEYPFVWDHNGRRLMLYNGNGFGLTGFGLAVFD